MSMPARPSLQSMNFSSEPRQIPFSFGVIDNMEFRSFYAKGQELLIEACKQVTNTGGEQQLYIWGGAGSGKTHLLTASCNLAAENGQRIAYIPAEIITEDDTLLGLEQLDLVCIDNVQRLSARGERALFNLINDIRAQDGSLMLTADKAPFELNINLADLVSRLSWGPVFQLTRLDDKGIRCAFKLRAESFGLQLPDEVTDYILFRQTRDIQVLGENLKQLLNAASVSKRRLTVPFAKEVLGL